MFSFQVPKIINVNGCLDKLQEIIEGNVAALGGVGVAIALIQVIWNDIVFTGIFRKLDVKSIYYFVFNCSFNTLLVA